MSPMDPRTFFRLSLLLPVVVPGVAYLIGPVNWLLGLLMISALVGGLAYVVFAVVAFVWIGRLSTARAMLKLSWFGPILFFGFLGIGLLGWGYFDRGPDFSLADWLEYLPVFAFYSAILGYGYVGVVNLAWALADWRGWIRADPGDEREE